MSDERDQRAQDRREAQEQDRVADHGTADRGVVDRETADRGVGDQGAADQGTADHHDTDQDRGTEQHTASCEHRDVAWEPSPVVLWTDVESTVHRLRCAACGVETALIDHRRLPAL